jgi:ABC-type polysaccharide/polyol phosphate transport system ATPase subunit
MSDTVIRVENLSKKYIIGHQTQGEYTTLRERIADGVKSIGHRLLKPTGKHVSDLAYEEFWALKDVSFEIKQGDCVGIIGRNGAGKSTLLKILSRITEPTRGRISIKGRVASLLEVGTGFHPELTGRENIYLNGAILGMTRQEIKRKFDEIVAFAEVERFLDTPVKRYSSGMYMRLAFAVAAHLEPEILIVDEVLAVGDVQFQKKCLGKIQNISKGQGRSILFVSHNLDAIQRLCSRCLLLKSGELIANSNTASTVAHYLSKHSDIARPNEWIDVSHVNRTGTGEVRYVAAQYSSLNEDAAFQPYSNGPLEFLLALESDSSRSIGSIAVTLYSLSGTKFVNADTVSLGRVIVLRKGRNLVRLRIKNLYLNPGTYVVGLWLANPTGAEFDHAQSAFEIKVINLESQSFGMRPYSDGVVICPFELLEVS